MTDKRLQMPLSWAQIVIKYLLDSQPCENVLYCKRQSGTILLDTWADDDFSSGHADTVADKVKTWLMDEWSPAAHGLAKATEVEVIWNTVVGVGPLAGQVYQDSDYPVVGTEPGDPLPNNATVAVEWGTDLLGRSYHGRSYHVGLTTNQITTEAPNVLNATALTGIPDAYDSLRSALAASVDGELDHNRYPLLVASFIHDHVARTPAVGTVIRRATISDPFLDSMRRRLPAHNRHGRRR